MTFTRDTIRTVQRNAGKMPVEEIAAQIAMSVSFVERLAREHGIDLRIAPPPLPEHEPLTAHAAMHPHHQHMGRARSGRTEQVYVKLFAEDARALEVAGASHGLRRGPTLARLVENARERGLIEELVRLPAPIPKEGEGI